MVRYPCQEQFQEKRLENTYRPRKPIGDAKARAQKRLNLELDHYLAQCGSGNSQGRFAFQGGTTVEVDAGAGARPLVEPKLRVTTVTRSSLLGA